MRKKAIFGLKILLATSAVFSVVLFILFFLSGSILPEDGDADSILGLTLGYFFTGVVFTLIPSILVSVAFTILDICIAAVRNKRPALIACMVISVIFLPLFVLSTIPYFVIVNYAKWLYAIIIPAYFAYLLTIATCAVALAADVKASKQEKQIEQANNC